MSRAVAGGTVLFETCTPGDSERPMALVLGQMLDEIDDKRDLPNKQNAAAQVAWRALNKLEGGEVDDILEVDLYFSAADELELAVLVSVSRESTVRTSIAIMSTRDVMDGKPSNVRADFQGVVVFWDSAGEHIEKVEWWLGGGGNTQSHPLAWVEIKIDKAATARQADPREFLPQNVSEIRAHLKEQNVVELPHDYIWSFDHDELSNANCE